MISPSTAHISRVSGRIFGVFVASGAPMLCGIWGIQAGPPTQPGGLDPRPGDLTPLQSGDCAGLCGNAASILSRHTDSPRTGRRHAGTLYRARVYVLFGVGQNPPGMGQGDAEHSAAAWSRSTRASRGAASDGRRARCHYYHALLARPMGPSVRLIRQVTLWLRHSPLCRPLGNAGGRLNFTGSQGSCGGRQKATGRRRN